MTIKEQIKHWLQRRTKPLSATAPHKGQLAETLAKQFLQQQGLIYVTRNYRCRLGEIDLIFTDKDDLVFVEVRQRSHNSHGGSLNSITRHKQQKIIRAAEHYLQTQVLNKPSKPNNLPPCRFDVIGIDQDLNIDPHLRAASIQWIKAAFWSE